MKKIFMATVALTAFAASIALFQLTSCKKAAAQIPRDCPPPTYPVAGIYIGTYSASTMPANWKSYYSFVVFPDNKILTKGVTEFGDTVYSQGSWTLSADSVFTATIKTFETPAVIQEITGNFSKDGKISNANWHDTYNPWGGGVSGKFSIMQRVN